ncbi:YmfL family putative regulatory protein [Pseudomonas oryzihabitans]|uniref:YmfL family putative regulatory protein n=1 Tax=Pseudomonas oryzihabitans TaxID=47885 RepID=UPI0028952B14|nr:YmfL family putative regulatory protein [Pseudomonas oryzihabitans]MDT3723193.1 YmfL family putative regulatory protein [Pseudomonas oryzihabitans]
MKRPALETRRQVVSAVICAYPGGRECAAARLGLPLKKFDNHAYETAGSRPLTDEQIRLLEQETGTTHLVDYLAGQYGGFFVRQAEVDDLDNVDLYARSVETAVRRGRLNQLIAQALEDGVIDEKEVVSLLAAHRHYMAGSAAEMHAVVTLHVSKPGGKPS